MNDQQRELLRSLAKLYAELADECASDDAFHDVLIRNNDLFPRSLEEMSAEWYAVANNERCVGDIGSKVYELLRVGNFQARVIRDIAPFKKGMDVDMALVANGMVAVCDIETEQLYEEYNLDTHDDYDKYFEIY